jgi:uncharacterized protein YndB with AHSA1/START domain
LSGIPRTVGDEVNVSVLVAVEPDQAFRVFTEEIDQWWRRGLKYRVASGGRSVLRLEPRVGGRLLESFDGDSGPKLLATGTVTVWEPPFKLVFEWRALNFAPSEKTEVEVKFEATPSGTLVTVKHRGWSRIRPDHPVRHGLEVRAFIRMMGLWWADLMTSMREHISDVQ